MKLVEKKVVTTYVPNIKKGCFYELTDTLSCDVINIKVLNVTDIRILFLNLRNNNISQIYFENAEKYEVRELKLTYANEEDDKIKSVKIEGDVKRIDFLKKIADEKVDINNLELDKDKSITNTTYMMPIDEFLNLLNQHINKEV